jgi:hypothetical protein
MPSSSSAYSHPAIDAITAMSAALDDFAESRLWSLSERELGPLVQSLERVSHRVSAAQTQLVGQAASSGAAERDGATSTHAWLKAIADVPVAVGKARLALHRSLRARQIADSSFGRGDIGFDAAAAVCAAVEGLPPAVPAALVETIEEVLVEVAREEGTRAVVRRAAEIVHRFAPDELERTERDQVEQNRLSLVSCHNGTVAVRGVLDREAGALAFAILGPLAAPLAAVDGIPDQRTAPNRYADAFVRVLQLAGATSADVRGDRPHIVVTTSLATLQGLVGSPSGHLGTGEPLSGAAARRLACDAFVIPMVLGSKSEPLDVGRGSRTGSQGLHRALEIRDGGCAAPGCDRPAAWCDAHHLIHWADGGETSLENLVLLCARHHGVVHHDGWQIIMREGLPWFIPPRWIDPDQKPRQNSRYKLRDLGADQCAPSPEPGGAVPEPGGAVPEPRGSAVAQVAAALRQPDPP